MIKLYSRDCIFSNMTIIDYFGQAGKKLGWNLSDAEIRKCKKEELICKISQWIRDEQVPNESLKQVYDDYLERVSETEIANNEKWRQLTNKINEGYSVKDLYQSFTIDDLKYLGW